MQIFLLSKLTEKTLITKKIFKFASLGRPSASLAPLEKMYVNLMDTFYEIKDTS